MSTERTDPVGAQPTDPPWARLLFLLVQGREGQWWRGLLLMALTGLLLVGVLAVLLVFVGWSGAGWTGGALGLGGLAAMLAARRRHRRPATALGHRGPAADAADLEADPA